MPLIKSSSDEARSKNIATEVREGKPQKQAEAIGYAVQKKAEHHKPKEMSLGEAVIKATQERLSKKK